MTNIRVTHEWAKKALELALDYGVDSLRVGSHERKDIIQNNHVYTWETIQLREKREKSREALTRHLFSAVEAVATVAPESAQKRRLTHDGIYKALRESGLTAYVLPDNLVQTDYEQRLEHFANIIFNLN